MSTNNFSIEPFEYVKRMTATSMTLKVIQFVLFTSVIIHVTLLDDDNVVVHSTNIEISGDDYLNWANDDNYIHNYVATKLGIVVRPSPDPV
jgi:hypothetical protein